MTHAMSDIFPWLTREENERSIHLNLISRVSSCEYNCSQLQAKLQVAQGSVEELEVENARLKELMRDLLVIIREYSDKHERPDEILFVLDRIVAAYRTAFDSAGDTEVH